MADNKYKKTSIIIVKIFFFFTLFIGAIYHFQRNMMYFPTNEQFIPSQYNLGDMELITLETEDKHTIKGLYKKPISEDRPTIIFFHGNAGHIGHREYKIRPLINAGYGVLLAEYRGYGFNDGDISEENFYKDARAYINLVKDNSEIILYGESIGSGVATQMATEFEIKALILETPFDSALNVAKKTYPFIPFIDLLMHDKYLNDEKIPNINAPKLFLLAKNDQVVGFNGGKRLADLADSNKQVNIFESAGHNNIYQYNAHEKIISFINGL